MKSKAREGLPIAMIFFFKSSKQRRPAGHGWLSKLPPSLK
jgi:hypothetical protein